MAGCRAVGNHGNRFARRVGGVIQDFHVQHRGQAAQALRADAQRVHFFINFQAQLLHRAQFRARFGFVLQFVDINMPHQAFFCQQHGFFRRAADANAQNAGWTPARTHSRHGFQHPIHNAVGWVQHGEFGFIFRTAAFCCANHFHLIARHDFGVYHRRRVVFGVDALARRVCQYRRAQHVIRMRISAAHAFVHHFLHAHIGIPLHIHANF